ncbi:MAG: hypothetical protein PHG02_05695 [Oscillospiraceae bacterium]|nr:hypothetical protein [Oscillospiraceae bacterium]
MSAIGITVSDDKKAQFDEKLIANYKTISQYEKQSDKITSLTAQLKTATDGLKAFEGVDVSDLKAQIIKLQDNLREIESCTICRGKLLK